MKGITLAASKDHADAAHDEVARGEVRLEFDQLHREIEPVRAKNQAVSLEADVAEKQVVLKPNGIDVELRRIELDKGCVVPVKNDGVVCSEGRLHRSRLRRSDPHCDKALPITAAKRLAEAKVI